MEAFPEKRYLDEIELHLGHLNEVDIFEKLFDDDIITIILSETRRYASQKNEGNFLMSDDDLKKLSRCSDPQWLQCGASARALLV
jgi:hypothetical protein